MLSDPLLEATGQLTSLAWRVRREWRRRVACSPRLRPATERGILLLSHPDRISRSQFFPFHYHRRALWKQWRADLIELDLKQAMQPGAAWPEGVHTVCLQLWLHARDEEIAAAVRQVRQRCPGARLVFFDPLAPTDLRMAGAVAPHADLYVKKHVLRDRSQYGRPTRGDTNLSDWYGPHHGHAQPEVRWPVPSELLDRLVVGPSFLTAEELLPAFDWQRAPRDWRHRTLDLHARIGGTDADAGWYGDMRRASVQAVRSLSGCRVSGLGPVSRRAYMKELRQARLCLSPFGYGEVCWRDYEAIASGTLILKQDCRHVETWPDLFADDSTYVPLRWDLADLGEKVAQCLEAPADALARTRRAHALLHDFCARERFAQDFVPKLLGLDTRGQP